MIRKQYGAKLHAKMLAYAAETRLRLMKYPLGAHPSPHSIRARKDGFRYHRECIESAKLYRNPEFWN